MRRAITANSNSSASATITITMTGKLGDPGDILVRM